MKVRLIFLFLISMFFIACISYPFMLDKSFPSGDKYEILGTVSFTGRTTYILGIPIGGARYADLLGEAIKKYKTVDDVVSVSVDREFGSVLGIVTWVDTTLRGIAIRYVDSR